MSLSEQDKKRLEEIDIELEKIHKLFEEYHSWYDKKPIGFGFHRVDILIMKKWLNASIS